MDVTIYRGNLGKEVIRNWDKYSSKRQFSDARQLGCVFQDMTTAEVYSPEGYRHAEADPACEVHKGYCTSYQNSRPKFLARLHLSSVNLMSVAPTLRNFRIVHKKRTEWQEQWCPRSSVEAGQKCVKNERSMKKQHSSRLRENRCHLASTLKPEEREVVVDSRSVNAHDQQKGHE